MQNNNDNKPDAVTQAETHLQQFDLAETVRLQACLNNALLDMAEIAQDAELYRSLLVNIRSAMQFQRLTQAERQEWIANIDHVLDAGNDDAEVA